MATTLTDALRKHWPEYLIEGWALGTFTVSAGLVATLLGAPMSPLHRALPDPLWRNAAGGIAMGLTAIALIHSGWGKRSGAHMNPAVTLTFLRLGKTQPWDALFFVTAQVLGGMCGVLLVAALAGHAFSDPPVSYAVLMLTVLSLTATARLAPYTGLIVGGLVALYITFESPLSGMSMNPARSLASAAPGMLWHHLWIYLTAPVLGMLAGAQVFLMVAGARRVVCAKLLHPLGVRCIHCGHEPREATRGEASPAQQGGACA